MSLAGMSAIGTVGSNRWGRDCRYWLVVETGIWKGGSLNRARLIAMFGERRAQPLAYDRAEQEKTRDHSTALVLNRHATRQCPLWSQLWRELVEPPAGTV
jgi:hypothetical protein